MLLLARWGALPLSSGTLSNRSPLLPLAKLLAFPLAESSTGGVRSIDLSSTKDPVRSGVPPGLHLVAPPAGPRPPDERYAIALLPLAVLFRPELPVLRW